jgi:tetratricopeptide (TPR) repeat protein
LSNLFLNRSFAVKLELADPKFRGTLMYIQGLSVYWTGDLSRSDSNLEEAIDELRRCFESYESTVSIHMRRHIAAYEGAAGDELEFARQVLSQSTEMNMFKLICWGNYDKASALARLGELPQAVESIQRANGALGQERFIMTEPIRASTDAYVRIQCSDYAAANERASLAWNLIKENWMFIDVSLLCLPFLVESRVGPNWAQESKSRDRQAIQRALRAASIFYRTLPNQQPHLLRVAGRALYAFGKKRKSIRKLERAVALAKRNGMEYQQARCLLDLAAIKEEDRDDNRSLAIELLKKMESVIPRAESWLLGEQYDEAVVAPEFDLKAWERENGPVSSQREELV